MRLKDWQLAMKYYKHAVFSDVYGKRLEWRCQNRTCRIRYAEYVNGCPRCATGDPGGSHSVRLETATPMAAGMS
jgi:hypothetical protein